jgi:hypothetical protein
MTHPLGLEKSTRVSKPLVTAPFPAVIVASVRLKLPMWIFFFVIESWANVIVVTAQIIIVIKNNFVFMIVGFLVFSF